MNIPPLPLNGITVAQHGFDDSPIYDDFSVLTRWLDNRQKSNSARVALFYNTISLHDGNHLTGPNSNLNSLDSYKIRLTKLLDDLEKFMQSLEKSGRRAVVAMVPEHGAAVRGDKMQIAGLREIPSPAITLVPVGIKVIGDNLQREGDTLMIDDTTSYLAVSHIVARMLEKSPFAKNSFSRRTIPPTCLSPRMCRKTAKWSWQAIITAITCAKTKPDGPNIPIDMKSPHKHQPGISHAWHAMGVALQGLRSAFEHEDAFRQELLIAAFAIPVALLSAASTTGKAVMIGSILLVLIIELLNSALEAAVDHTSLDPHPLAKRAKDIASAAVFLSIVNAVIIWVLILFG